MFEAMRVNCIQKRIFAHVNKALFCSNKFFCYRILLGSLRKHAYSNITENFQIKNTDIFHISAHRLWVLVRTTLARQFQRVPTIYVFEQK